MFLLNALNSLLAAKNDLIGNWVAYETARLSLYRDFDLMNIDARGVWTNEQYLRTLGGPGDGSSDVPRLLGTSPDDIDAPPPLPVLPEPDPLP